MQKITIPANWQFEHIPQWEYDEDGEIEVSNFTCRVCIHHNQCKCIDHQWVHFFRPYFSCDVGTAHHTICKAFEPHPLLYPAGCLEWQALGGFDEWQRLWRKQWHSQWNGYDYSPACVLIRAIQTKGREHSDDRYIVTYDDFTNCNIMHDEGIHCLDYVHVEIARNTPTGYKWVHEGRGLWVPWKKNTYLSAQEGE